MAQSKVSDMLLGIAVGDAFGAGYEFAFKTLAGYRANFEISGYRDNPTRIKGMYTDDTQMSIAVSELLLSNEPFTKENLATFFYKCYTRYPIEGYSRRMKSGFESSISGIVFMQNIDTASEGNGAAMRALPIGMLHDPKTIVEYATINAQVTHNTPKGIASSVAAALMDHYYLYNLDEIVSLHDFVLPHIKQIDLESFTHFQKILKIKDRDNLLLFGEGYEDKGVQADGMRTVGVVMHLLSKYHEPRAMLEGAILLGGDADTVASMSLGLICAKKGIENIPSVLISSLTNHMYGRDYIINLGEKLAKKFGV